MKPEYDFSKGERGKFYKPDAKMGCRSISMSRCSAAWLNELRRRVFPLGEMVNALLKHEIRIIESVKWRLLPNRNSTGCDLLLA